LLLKIYMQSNFIEDRNDNRAEISASNSMILTYNESAEQSKEFLFQANFVGSMDMFGDIDTVANYLNSHQGWFCRCAQPMQVEPLGNNGYILIVGRFGSFGYEVEPKIAVVLNPPEDRIYTMYSIPVPNYHPCGYDVNYQASMKLSEASTENYQNATNLFKKQIAVPNLITRVNWTLNLKVKVEFPKFIHKLPSSMIQSTGDRLVVQIVRQISPRLTYKVQQDFHNSHNLPLPPKSSSHLERVCERSV
jgi:hypothetical protein